MLLCTSYRIFIECSQNIQENIRQSTGYFFVCFFWKGPASSVSDRQSVPCDKCNNGIPWASIEEVKINKRSFSLSYIHNSTYPPLLPHSFTTGSASFWLSIPPGPWVCSTNPLPPKRQIISVKSYCRRMTREILTMLLACFISPAAENQPTQQGFIPVAANKQGGRAHCSTIWWKRWLSWYPQC